MNNNQGVLLEFHDFTLNMTLGFSHENSHYRKNNFQEIRQKSHKG